MAWQSSTINQATTSPAADIGKITNDLQQLRGVIGGTPDAAIPSVWTTPVNVLGQVANSGTTSGSGTAYTLTPAQAITAYTAGMTFWVTFHAAAGAAPTLQISGVSAPPTLVRQDSTGAYVNIAANDFPANHRSRVTLLSATQALVEEMPPPTAGFLDTTRIDVASATTVNLTTGAPTTRHINITGTTAITGFTVAAGLTYFVRFAASLTLTNGAGLVTQTGANIVTQSGDTCILRATAVNTVEVVSYVPAKNASQPGSAPVYGARAWFVFDGTLTGTNAPTAGGNVSSVQRESAGVYLITFSSAMPDTSFCTIVTAQTTAGSGGRGNLCSSEAITTTTVRIRAVDASNGSALDQKIISGAVFR